MQEKQWHSNVYTMLLHASEPCILLLPGAGGWTLPHLQCPGRAPLPHVEPINHLLAQHLGVRTTVLRCAHVREVAHQLEAVYVLENHRPGWQLPPGWQWVGRKTLADLPLAVPEHRDVLDACLAEMTCGVIPDLRPPWARVGWFATAESWILEQLDRLDAIVMVPIEQVRSWGISCILRARTMTGDVYFKASSSKALFAHEPTLMQALATLYPDYLPTLLAVDQAQDWMLLAGFRSLSHDQLEYQSWENALCTFGRLQRASAAQANALLAAGCHDRRLHTLTVRLASLLCDTDALAYLQADERARLYRLAPQLQAMCSALAQYRVPHTLVHGDLHAKNIVIRNGRYLFFDWTDGCVAHPFFDLVVLLLYAAALPNAAAAAPRLRDAYLALWTDYEPMPRLREAWALAKPLGALHQAISYQHMVASLEPAVRHELHWGVPFWVRQVLQSVP